MQQQGFHTLRAQDTGPGLKGLDHKPEFQKLVVKLHALPKSTKASLVMVLIPHTRLSQTVAISNNKYRNKSSSHIQTSANVQNLRHVKRHLPTNFNLDQAKTQHLTEMRPAGFALAYGPTQLDCLQRQVV